MKCKIITTKLGNIEFSTWGKGAPILILHGGHSNCQERLYHKGIDLKKYRLIIPSRPGYGATSLEGNNTPGESAKLCVELLNYLELDSVIIYGVSAGGLTAIEFAANYPGKVKKLILASAVTKSWEFPRDKNFNRAKIIFHPRYENFTWSMIRMSGMIAPAYTAKWFLKHFSSKACEKLEEKEIYSLVYALRHYRSYNGFTEDIKQGIEKSLLKRITCPTLIIHSEYDKMVSIDQAVFAHLLIPNSRLIKLQNDWGHLLWIGKDSCACLEHIGSFLEDAALGIEG